MTTSYAILYATVSAIEITSLRFHVATNDASFECLRFENQQPRCSAKRFLNFSFLDFSHVGMDSAMHSSPASRVGQRSSIP